MGLSLICIAWILGRYGIKITIDRKETVHHIVPDHPEQAVENLEETPTIKEDPMGKFWEETDKALKEIDKALLGEEDTDE